MNDEYLGYGEWGLMRRDLLEENPVIFSKGGEKMQVEIQGSGDFLKGEFVKDNKIDSVVFIKEPVMKETNFGKKVQGEIEYKGKGKEDPHIWTLNNTSARLLVSAFGSDTKNWMGKEIPIEPSRTEKGYAIYVDEKKLKTVQTKVV